MAGFLLSTPFSISAHELARAAMAKFAMMFKSEFRRSECHLPSA